MLEFALPLPPSVNDMWVMRNGGLYKSARYKTWAEEAGWSVKRQMAGLSGFGKQQVEVEICVPLDRRRDVDNFIKPALDLLQKMKVYRNDNQVARIKAERADCTDILIKVRPI